MKLEINSSRIIEPIYLQVDAVVRYWDDAKINGEEAQIDGEDTPLKVGDSWRPLIRLSDGVILDWPQGTTAKTHYKVCDSGNYYLLDADNGLLASRENNYVPDCLSPQQSGYGDYIILNIDENGVIAGWRGDLDSDDWEADE